MISHRDPKFDRHFKLMPAHIRELARKTYRLWRANPWHPSLQFKEWAPGHWSVRVGRDYRALAVERPDGAYLWWWIGPHQTYDKLLRR